MTMTMAVATVRHLNAICKTTHNSSKKKWNSILFFYLGGISIAQFYRLHLQSGVCVFVSLSCGLYVFVDKNCWKPDLKSRWTWFFESVRSETEWLEACAQKICRDCKFMAGSAKYDNLTAMAA